MRPLEFVQRISDLVGSDSSEQVQQLQRFMQDARDSLGVGVDFKVILQVIKNTVRGIDAEQPNEEPDRDQRNLGISLTTVPAAKPILMAIAMSDDDRFNHLKDELFIQKAIELAGEGSSAYITPDFEVTIPLPGAVANSVEYNFYTDFESDDLMPEDDEDDDFDEPYLFTGDESASTRIAAKFEPLPTSEILKVSITILDARPAGSPEMLLPGEYGLLRDGLEGLPFRLAYKTLEGGVQEVEMPKEKIVAFLSEFDDLKIQHPIDPVGPGHVPVYSFSGEEVYNLIGKYGHIVDSDSDFLVDQVIKMSQVQLTEGGREDEALLQLVKKTIATAIKPEADDSLKSRLLLLHIRLKGLTEDERNNLDSKEWFQELKEKLQSLQLNALPESNEEYQKLKGQDQEQKNRRYTSSKSLKSVLWNELGACALLDDISSCFVRLGQNIPIDGANDPLRAEVHRRLGRMINPAENFVLPASEVDLEKKARQDKAQPILDLIKRQLDDLNQRNEPLFTVSAGNREKLVAKINYLEGVERAIRRDFVHNNEPLSLPPITQDVKEKVGKAFLKGLLRLVTFGLWGKQSKTEALGEEVKQKSALLFSASAARSAVAPVVPLSPMRTQ